MNSNIEIIHATWEKLNLGKDVTEIIVPIHPDLAELKNCILNLDTELIYVKVHHSNIEAIKFLEKLDFEYCENLFTIKKRLRFFKMHTVFENALSNLYSKPVNNIDLENIFYELDKNMFNSDRIALDPNFGQNFSNLRYKNWLNDMYNLKDEYQINIIKNKYHKPIGFYTNQYKGKIAYAPLGGVFSDYQNKGLSHSIIYFPLIDALNNNCKVLKTQISGNNVPVFNIYSSVFGFEITENYVVLKKFV